MCLRKSEALRSHPTLPLDCSWVVLCIYSTWLFLSCIFYNKLTIVSEEFSCILYAILANIETCRGMGFGQYCCCSVAKSCPTICDSMDCSMPASLSFTISWSLLKFMSIESVMVSNHHILLPTSPFAFSLCQHQGLFQWIGSSHQMAKVLELQHQSYQWIFSVNFL